MSEQLQLFEEKHDDIERQIKILLDRRRRFCCSGINGEDVNLIRAALIEKKGKAS